MERHSPPDRTANRVRAALIPARLRVFSALTCSLLIASSASALLDRSPSGAPDGLSDVWAFVYDYRASSTSATADTDGDGLSDREEARAGTNPRDPGSRAYVGLAIPAPGLARIQFPSQAGKRYQLQETNSLAPAAWTTFATRIGTGAALSADTPLGSSANAFYRAVIDDIDTDGDGLADWEERAVGYDPATANTRREPGNDLDRLAERLNASDQISIGAMANESSEAWPRTMTVAIRRRQGFRPLSLTVGLSGTATRGVDYASPFSSSANVVNFAPDEREKYFTFTPLADALDAESAESIVLTLTPAGAATVVGPNTVTLTIANSTATGGPAVPEASRFLQQATFGADDASIAAVMSRGFANWIADEAALPNPGRISPWVHRQNKTAGTSSFREQTPVYPNPSLIESYQKHVGIWHAIMGRRDPLAPSAESGPPSALRQRAAYALSQILVVSEKLADLHYHTEGMADYWDTLLAHSFGNYRDLLRAVTLHPCMGVYLSHLKNRKADPLLNRYPD
ncbi:MAG: hypothetical protein RLZZ50_1195 [Verrucomicrobiota bacterium]